MIITLEHYFLWFLFYSFVGWMYESILCFFCTKLA